MPTFFRAGHKLKGPWGERAIMVSSQVDMWAFVMRELIRDGILPADSREPTNKYHSHVTMTVMECSYIGGKWVRDLSPAKS